MKAVIFDLDGTLLYTLKDLYLSVNEALKHFNYPTRTLEEIRRFVGNGIRNLMFQACPENIPDFEECLEYFKNYYSVHSQDNTVAYDGIFELLEALKEKDIPCAVVSNKFEAATKELVEKHFKGYFATVVGEGAGVPKKPDPAGVFEVMKRFNIDDKNEIVLIGDAETDIATARNAGIKCITVTWGFRDKDYLIEQGATVFVDKPEEILNLI